LKRVNNPTILNEIVSKLKSKTQFDRAIEIGKACLSVLANLKGEAEERKRRSEEEERLKEEEIELDSKRKTLSLQDKQRQFDLEFQRRLELFEPSFTQLEIKRYDSMLVNVAVTIIECSDQAVKDYKSKMEKNEQLSEEEKQGELKKLQDRSASIVKECISFINDVPTLIQFADVMKTKG